MLRLELALRPNTGYGIGAAIVEDWVDCADWRGLRVPEDLPRPTRRCEASGRELNAKDFYWSWLRDTPEGVERKDFGVDQWQGAPGDAFAWWRGRLPASQADAEAARQAKSVGERLAAAFESLEGATEPTHLSRRFALALLLMRRRALKLQGIEADGGGEVLVFSAGRGKPTVRVRHPEMSDEELQQLERDVAAEFMPTAA